MRERDTRPGTLPVIGKATVARRYRYLWRGELIAAGGFLLVFAISVSLEESWRSWILRVFGICLVLNLLVQGALWWRGRLRDLEAHRPRPETATFLGFGSFRRINWVLIGAFPLLAAWRWLAFGPIPAVDLGWGIALLLGAVLEQINYYHYQLSYGYGQDFWYLRRHRRLRRGNIARYLARGPTVPHRADL